MLVKAPAWQYGTPGKVQPDKHLKVGRDCCDCPADVLLHLRRVHCESRRSKQSAGCQRHILCAELCVVQSKLTRPDRSRDQLVGNVNLDLLAQRPLDGAFVLRNHASEEYGPKHVYKLNSENEKEAVYISRKSPEGKQVGFEKIWRRRCPRCELVGECSSRQWRGFSGRQ